MGQVYTYPNGPQECEYISGKCPKISSPSDSNIIFLYVCWAITIPLFASYYAYRQWYRKDKKITTSSTPMPASPPKATPAVVATEDLYANLLSNGLVSSSSSDVSSSSSSPVDYPNETNSTFITIPYRSNWFGSICQLWMSILSFGWIAIFIILLVDSYFDCQLKSIDSLCYYGSYPILGTYDSNSEYFFTIWVISVTWFGTLLVYKNQIRGFFMEPCEMLQAEYMYVWSKDALVNSDSSRSCEYTDTSPVLLVQCIRRVRLSLTPIHLREGHESLEKMMVNAHNVPYFVHESTRYVYNASTSSFRIPSEQTLRTFMDFHASIDNGLDSIHAEKKLAIFGPNKIPFERSSMGSLFKKELFTYFYFYQAIMYAVWFWQSYLLVASIESVLVILGAVVSVYIQWNNEKTISALTEYETIVKVKRDGKFEEISSNDLIPGDIFEISQLHWVMPCDAVLLTGGLVMDESGLTGESMPVLKTACPNTADLYDPDHGGVRHALFAGTTVLQLNLDKNRSVIAKVSATGTGTCKGQLVSTILYPEQLLFRYEEELEVVICFLLLYGLFAFSLSLYLQSNNGTSASFVTKWAFGMFTCSQIFSPLLPVALKVGQIRSSKRLLKKGIFCLTPRRIAISGKVNIFAFDKTGTLTNDGMELSGVTFVRPKDDRKETVELCLSELRRDIEKDKDLPSRLIDCLAACHSISIYGINSYVGNDVEVKMFESTKWNLKNVPNSDISEVQSPNKSRLLRVHRKFEFDHAKQTMSVVVEDSKDSSVAHAFCKGSFEKIALLCRPETVPADFVSVAQQFALNGGYVLGLAHREIDRSILAQASSIKRDQFEESGSFTLLGLLIFRNEPKPDSKAAILEIRQGSVRPIMITGDNAQCGQYIAKSCALIDDHSRIMLGEWDRNTNQVTWDPMGTTKSDSSRSSQDILAKMSKDSRFTDQIQIIFDMDTRNSQYAEATTEYAISGNATLEWLDKNDLLDVMLPRIRIFARMSPQSKALIVTRLRSLGFIVGMCGDGGNDCGALRAAHAGIALSEAEASVVSPFTSKTKSIWSVVDLLKEGRASLATSFANYKFLISYGMIFSLVKLIGFYYGVIMSAMSYYSIDGLSITSLSYTMTLSPPVDILSKKRPTSSLLGPVTVVSSLGVNILAVICMFSALSLMSSDPDYVKWPADSTSSADWWTLADNWETTVMYHVFILFLISCSGIYSFGYTFRKPVIFNTALVLNIIIPFIFISVLLLADTSYLSNWWHIASYQFNKIGTESPVWAAYLSEGGEPSPGMSSLFRAKLYILIISFVALSILWQSLIMEGPVGKYLLTFSCFPKKKKMMLLNY